MSGPDRSATRPSIAWRALADDRVECLLCPHACRIAPGETALCRVRHNEAGRLVSSSYGRPVLLAVEPIEKKPLLHCWPGARTLSLGTAGCNLRCAFCLNGLVSQSVLPLDLDLEAPGLGAQLLPDDDRPEFGVVDWLTEDLVGSPTAEAMVGDGALVARSPLADPGHLYVAPATGKRSAKHSGSFIAKLARAYLDADREYGEGFAARVRRLVAKLEQALEPDLVLIDSRAGLHETAAAAILHLDADVLLFATDQPTVWEGYRYLLAQLAQMAHIRPGHGDDDWRLRLKMVYARASETQEALEGFRSRAYRLWLDCLYDEQPAGAADEAFSFAETDDAAPHYPLMILNDPRFEQFNPLEHLSAVGTAAIRNTFGAFMAALADRVLDMNPSEVLDDAG